MARMRLWRNTSVAAIAQNYCDPRTDTLGYEWDEDTLNGERPAGLVRLSSTSGSDLADAPRRGPHLRRRDDATHHLTLYRDDNGAGRDALVFGAGTVQWSVGARREPRSRWRPATLRMQQAT